MARVDESVLSRSFLSALSGKSVNGLTPFDRFGFCLPRLRGSDCSGLLCCAPAFVFPLPLKVRLCLLLFPDPLLVLLPVSAPPVAAHLPHTFLIAAVSPCVDDVRLERECQSASVRSFRCLLLLVQPRSLTKDAVHRPRLQRARTTHTHNAHAHAHQKKGPQAPTKGPRQPGLRHRRRQSSGTYAYKSRTASERTSISRIAPKASAVLRCLTSVLATLPPTSSRARAWTCGR